jgi:hypothetical protein
MKMSCCCIVVYLLGRFSLGSCVHQLVVYVTDGASNELIIGIRSADRGQFDRESCERRSGWGFPILKRPRSS